MTRQLRDAAEDRGGARGGRRQLSDARREAMIQRLEELFLAEGFSRLTIDDIAARLQCSKSTLYGVAKSKDQLVVAAMKYFFRHATVLVEAAVADVEDPRERIAVYLASVGDQMRRMSIDCYTDMIRSESAGLIYQLNSHASARRVRELIHEGVDSGVLRGVHAEFVAESASLLIDAIMRGQLLERTGLSSGDAYHQLSVLVLKAVELDGADSVPLLKKRRRRA